MMLQKQLTQKRNVQHRVLYKELEQCDIFKHENVENHENLDTLVDLK